MGKIKGMTTEIIPREKCRFCHVYLPKNCFNDVCLECSGDQRAKNG